jgi:hypothetical protein
MLAAVAFLWLPATPTEAQKGHVVVGNEVRINRASHWRVWQGAASLVQISSTGEIRPLLLRKGVNAALDVADHAITGTPGGVTAGSSPFTARFTIDGNDATSWGPAISDPLADWWLEIDLGRLVVAQKIIIRFADETEGDPFLQFKVLGWRQPPPRSTTTYTLAGTRIPRFWEIGRTTRPNKTQRVFEFEPRPTEGADAAFVGDPLERLQLIATHSDSSRAFEVSAVEHAALRADRKGAVDYYRRTQSGSVRQVTQAEYDGFAEEQQGPIRYYRQEIPRIAEIEVITVGDNINLGLLDRSGTAVIETSGGDLKDIAAVISDGDYSKGHNGSIFSKTYEYLEDLGGLFWVDTMHYLTDGASSIDALSVDISDGSRAPDGSIRYDPVGESNVLGTSGHSSSKGIRFRELHMEPAKVRYVRARFSNPLSGLSYIGFTEVMIYGEGYVPGVELTSDLIELGQSKNLIAIEWLGDMPEGTRIQLQTRTGGQPREVTTYHDAAGNAVTESRYQRLPTSKRGEITTHPEPGEDWSPWSVAYSRSGAEITSPSPRPFLQLRARLETDHVNVAATLRSVVLQMADPVADRLVGEVWPLRIGTVGAETEFSLYIRPEIGSGTQGFDEIRVEATAGARIELVGVNSGSDGDFQAGMAVPLAVRNGTPQSAPESLHIRLARRLSRGVDVVEVRFRATILGNSASFRAFVRDGEDGFWQRVDEGDATQVVNSQRVTVLALQGVEVLTGLTLSGQVLTPNDDGVNDDLVLSFAVARVNDARPVRLTIHDLAGREVQRVAELRQDARGQYALRWDGTDTSGQLVAPGIYLARIVVEADAASAEHVSAHRVIHVAY